MIPKHIVEWLDEMRKKGCAVRMRGTVDMALSREELEQAMLVEHDGGALLSRLENEWCEAERLGLVNHRQGTFHVPRFESLVAFLRSP